MHVMDSLTVVIELVLALGICGADSECTFSQAVFIGSTDPFQRGRFAPEKRNFKVPVRPNCTRRCSDRIQARKARQQSLRRLGAPGKRHFKALASPRRTQ